MRLLLKTILVFAVTLAILIPLGLIHGTIDERQEYRNQAVANIARSYAGGQAFAGPVLVVPYTETVEVEEKDAQGIAHKVMRDVDRRWTFFPSTLRVQGTLTPDTRQLGLHKVRVYEWQGQALADFA
ncbi:MAG TPA: inner membrane CreD family protein, partial [Lysobacter sp.]|nr:inner membrane CreD family protein [Lysobacter sp.]